MDVQKNWEQALKNTQIIRPRLAGLSVSTNTKLPYIFLSEAAVNEGDTVVRSGKILVEKPALLLPSYLPQFEGFDLGLELQSSLTNFFLIRGITFPSLKYNNEMYALNIYEGKLEKAITHYLDKLKKEEDIQTGLITGPGEIWQFCLLVFICGQVEKSSTQDIKKLLEGFKKNQHD